MKQQIVQTLASGGNNYGQVSHPDDLMKAQEFGSERISGLLVDFVNNTKNHEITGCTYELGAGNAFNITIKKPGRITTKDGTTYDLLADPDVTLGFAEADDELPRLDLVVGVLEDAVDAAVGLIPFVRLRTEDEVAASAPPYPPQNQNAPRERHWRIVPQIKTGTPAPEPSIPTFATNEVPLYLVAIAPGAAAIRPEDVLDRREVIDTVRTLNEIVADNRIDIARLLDRITAVERIAGQPIDLSHVFGQIRTLGDILADLQRQLDALREVPEIIYPRPKVPLTDKASSQIPSTGILVSSVPTVQMEIGAKVMFGNAEVPLLPQRFKDNTLNARYVKITGGSANVSLSSNMTLEDVTQIAADGFTDFVQTASSFPSNRARPACAARNGQFVEVFAGLASDNFSALSDWYTYDRINDTLTARSPSISLPTTERPAAFSYGDGTHVLLICGTGSDSTPQVFKINCTTGAVTEITSTPLPQGMQFFGDLVSAGKIIVVAVKKTVSGYETKFFEFSTSTNTFAELGVTGSVPDLILDHADACFYEPDKLLLVSFTPGVSSSGKTYMFDRTTLVWTELNIPSPFGGSPAVQLPLSRFRLANVNGRPLLVGGLLTKDTDSSKAKIWELTPKAIEASTIFSQASWRSWDATFAPVQDPGFCSTLGATNLPTGLAFFFGGHGKYSDARSRIYASQQGGLIATTLDGDAAITIADTSSYAQFTIDPYTASWDVAAYLMSFAGDWHKGNLKAEVSFDNGAHWHTVTPDETFNVTDSDNPGHRLLRITLYNLKSSKPVLKKLTEVFDQDSADDLESRIVIHYNAPAISKALYLNRDGSVELSSIIEPSNADKCLIHKVTPLTSAAPILKNYINRKGHIKYEGDATDPTFNNELAVPVRYVHVIGVTDEGRYYKFAEPVVEFDAEVELTGLLVDETWIVELAG